MENVHQPHPGRLRARQARSHRVRLRVPPRTHRGSALVTPPASSVLIYRWCLWCVCWGDCVVESLVSRALQLREGHYDQTVLLGFLDQNDRAWRAGGGSVDRFTQIFWSWCSCEIRQHLLSHTFRIGYIWFFGGTTASKHLVPVWLQTATCLLSLQLRLVPQNHLVVPRPVGDSDRSAWRGSKYPGRLYCLIAPDPLFPCRVLERKPQPSRNTFGCTILHVVDFMGFGG